MAPRSTHMPNAAPSTPGAEEMGPLDRLEPTLPSESYSTAPFMSMSSSVFGIRIGSVGRTAGLEAPGMFRTLQLAAQNLLIVRDDSGRLRAFHNTCRHRGSVLCDAAEGAFSNGRIVCPYHAWTYALDENSSTHLGGWTVTISPALISPFMTSVSVSGAVISSLTCRRRRLCH